MGIYHDRVAPHLISWTCGASGLARWRARACEQLEGVVIEIGFGSGYNIEHYPKRIDVVHVVEPGATAMKMAAKRIANSPVAIIHAGIDAQALSLPDASCDSALVTFTLCTIPDAQRALQELRRVIRPGGTLHFLEHGLAPDRKVAWWQHKLDPLEYRISDGCHLIRQPLAMIAQAGFEPGWSEERYAKGPKPWSYFTIGVAINPT